LKKTGEGNGLLRLQTTKVAGEEETEAIALGWAHYDTYHNRLLVYLTEVACGHGGFYLENGSLSLSQACAISAELQQLTGAPQKTLGLMSGRYPLLEFEDYGLVCLPLITLI
jgi:hypothetical protein